MPWKVNFSAIFCAKSGNSELPHSSRNSVLNTAIADSRSPGGTENNYN